MSDKGQGEVRLVALDEVTYRSLLTDSEARGGLLGNVPRNRLQHAWNSGITEEEARALESGGAVPEGEPIPFDAVMRGRAKLRAAFNPQEEQTSE